MADFWCTVLRVERCFQGDVYSPHMALAGVTQAHLVRWLRLRHEHSVRLLLPQAAQSVAVGMARVMHLGWFEELPSLESMGGLIARDTGARTTTAV